MPPEAETITEVVPPKTLIVPATAVAVKAAEGCVADKDMVLVVPAASVTV